MRAAPRRLSRFAAAFLPMPAILTLSHIVCQAPVRRRPLQGRFRAQKQVGRAIRVGACVTVGSESRGAPPPALGWVGHPRAALRLVRAYCAGDEGGRPRGAGFPYPPGLTTQPLQIADPWCPVRTGIAAGHRRGVPQFGSLHRRNSTASGQGYPPASASLRLGTTHHHVPPAHHE